MNYNATDNAIKMQYASLLREARSSLVSIIEQFELQNEGQTILNSLDFFHMYDYLWDTGGTLDDPLLSRNLWTLKTLERNTIFPNLNIVATRGTVLEIADSLHHEIERIGEKETNRSILSDLRNKYQQLKRESFSLESYDYDYVSKLRHFEKALPVFQHRSNIGPLVKMFEDKKIQAYYDIIEFEKIKKHRRAINELSEKIAVRQGQYKRNRKFERDPIDDDLHMKVDSRNLGTAKIVSERIPGYKSFHITPNLNFRLAELESVRRSIYSVSYYMLSMLRSLGDEGSLTDPIDYQTVRSNIGFWASKVSSLLSELEGNDNIPQYVLDELAHVRRMLISIFYSREAMAQESFKARQKLLLMEFSDSEILDKLDEKREDFSSAARVVLKSEAHMIDRDMLYDHDLGDNPRAKELIKTYSK